MGINRTAHTFTAEAATSTLMNAEVKALWDGLQDSWTSYTPTWTSTGTAPAKNNGTLTGSYLRIGKTILWKLALNAGSTTSFGTGYYNFSLPFSLDAEQDDAIGNGTAKDNSASLVYGFTAAYDGSGNVRLYGSDGTRVGATAPFTFATFDHITLSGSGELP